jgi:hypothetical protein
MSLKLFHRLRVKVTGDYLPVVLGDELIAGVMESMKIRVKA